MTTFLLPLLLFAAPDDDKEGVRTVHQTVHRSFVAIEIRLRKKSRIERAEMEQDAQDTEAQRFLRLMESDQVFETWGIAVDRDLVLLPDHGLRDADVAELAMTDSTGKRFTGSFEAIGRRHDFVLVRTKAPHPLPAVSFSPWSPPKLGDYLYVTYATRVDARWHLNVSPYIMTNEPLTTGGAWFCIDPMRTGSIVSDKNGKTIGIALDQYLWTAKDGRSSFLGSKILEDERVTGLPEKYAAFRERLSRVVKRVEMTFRADRPADRFMPAPPSTAARAVVFGIPVDDRGTILVPSGLSREQIRRVEHIRVVEASGPRPATFVGAFRDFEAMLIRIDNAKGTAGLARNGVAPPLGELFFTATVENRFGGNRIKLRTNRLFRIESGLAGEPRKRPRRAVKSGSLLLDFEGRIVGFATYDKKREDADEMAARPSAQEYYMSRYRRQYRAEYLRRLMFSSELSEILADPKPHFDPTAVPMTKKEEKQLVWLGIEYQAMSKPIAEAMGVEKREFTNDGRRGLIVTELYDDSPARRAGLKLDDVLLSVQAPGEPARDLVPGSRRFTYPARSSPTRGRAMWKPTQNYLTRLLTEIGQGKNVSLQVLRGQKTFPVELVLDVAPRDFETAETFREETLGVTLKDLTYEVRHFQKLPPGTTGVVVSKVESGSRAEIGKLEPLSIVTRVNGVAVRDVAHARKLLSVARSLTLTTFAFGQTKLVELSRE